MNNDLSSVSREEAVLRQRRENQREEERRDASLDEALGFTFPASDPVATNCPVRALLVSRREHVQVSIDFFKRAWQKSRS